MPIVYRIIPEQKLLYVKGTGRVTADEIMTEGATMFADSEWTNGFHVLLDYREISELGVTREGVGRIVHQDKANEHLFDKSKCAIVAGSDVVFGVSRMWESLSQENKVTTMVFRHFEDALKWLGLDESVVHSIEDLP